MSVMSREYAKAIEDIYLYGATKEEIETAVEENDAPKIAALIAFGALPKFNNEIPERVRYSNDFDPVPSIPPRRRDARTAIREYGLGNDEETEGSGSRNPSAAGSEK